MHRLGGWLVRLHEHRRDDEMMKFAWYMPNESNYVYRSSSKRDTVQLHCVQRSSFKQDWKWSLNVLNGLLNGIVRDSRDNYREMMTEHTDQDHGRVSQYWDWMWRLSGALYRRHWLEWIPNWMWNDHTESYKPAWPILKEDEYNYWQAPCESHRLQGMISDTSRLADQAIHKGSGERNRAWIYIWYEWPFHEKLPR